MISDRLLGAANARHVTTPYYAFDLHAMAIACRTMIEAWSSQFDAFELAYSYKTNAIPAVTAALRDAGAGAEVVSGPELSKALADGHEPDRIYFDGPVKFVRELDQALRLGVRIQVDSVAEAQSICELVRRHDYPTPKVSMRLASRRRRATYSRFGLTTREFCQAADVLASGGIPVTGIHFNTGFHPPTAQPYRDHLRLYAPLLRELVAAQRRDPVVVDIGGGFPAASCADGSPLPHPLSFAVAVGEEFDLLGIPRDEIRLVIEPGRSLVEDHGVLASSVVAVKRRARRRIAVVDAGTNLVRSITSWHHPVRFIRPGRDAFDVYGAMCFESDVFAKDLRGPRDLGGGDRLVVGAAGGYDIPSANGWLRPLPAAYSIEPESGSLATIKEEGEHEATAYQH